jgi:glycosyltransferase involved in cell wall biosynthesis
MKLLIVYNKVWPYREKIFEIINEKYDLTVAYTDPKFLNKKYPYKTVFTPGKQLGPFFIHNDSLHKLCGQFDAVIGLYELRWLRLMALMLNPWRKYSMSFWGIGVSASYSNKFDDKKQWDFVRNFFGKKAESLIFYSDYPKTKFVEAGFEADKIFVANNTTYVSPVNGLVAERNTFLFVGTLYKEKGIDILLTAYRKIKTSREALPVLNIIGEGPERASIEKWVKEEGLEDKVFLHGAIYDSEILKTFYTKALACISPNQAGLSVLTSMGYSTIFVTEKNAITGGEVLNITHMENGIIYEGGVEALEKQMSWIIENKEEVIRMGKNAREHYKNNRTPEQMANSIMGAVEYALKKKKHA